MGEGWGGGGVDKTDCMCFLHAYTTLIFSVTYCLHLLNNKFVYKYLTEQQLFIPVNGHQDNQVETDARSVCQQHNRWWPE